MSKISKNCLTSVAPQVRLILAIGIVGGLNQLAAVTQEPALVRQGAYHAEVSPEGSRIAFGLLGDIWTVSESGGEAKQITSGHGWDHHPTYSSDGQLLAYVHDTPASSEIRLITLSTGTTRTIHARSPGQVASSTNWGPVFSFGRLRFRPGTHRLYFVDFRSGIWSVGTRGSSREEPVQEFEGSVRLGRPGITENSSFAFSPDGASIVLEKDTTDFWTSLHLGTVDRDDFRPLFALDKVKRTSADWTADGEAIVSVEQSQGIEYLSITRIDSLTTRRFELGVYNGRELAAHPNGVEAILISGGTIQRINLSNGSTRPIPFAASLTLPEQSPGNLVLANATLFDAITDTVIPGAHVIITDGLISSISNGPVPDLEGHQIIDAGGQFVMPGLVEAHNHVWSGGKFTQAAVLTRGITTVFNPGSVLPEIWRLREAIRLGVLEGPRLLTTGPTVDGPQGRSRPFTVANVQDPQVARRMVRELHALGVDAIKIYAFLEPEESAALIDEAHRLGLPVVGDLVTTSWSQALDQGVDGLIHLMDHKWRFISADSIPDPGDPWAVVQPDSVVMHSFFRRAAEQGVMFDPTMMGSARLYSAEAFREAYASEDHEDESVQRARTLGVILTAMHTNGVQWVAGTDIGPARLIDELETYEVIGIPNATILRTATANVARWLQRDDFGTIEPGRIADLIVVDGNPLHQVRDLDNVTTVVQGGRVVYVN